MKQKTGKGSEQGSEMMKTLFNDQLKDIEAARESGNLEDEDDFEKEEIEEEEEFDEEEEESGNMGRSGRKSR